MLNFQCRNLVTLDPRILHFKDLESLELQGNPGLHPFDSYSNAELIRCVANLNDEQDDLLIRCYLPKARRFNITMIETARQARFSDFEKLATAFEALSQKKAFRRMNMPFLPGLQAHREAAQDKAVRRASLELFRSLHRV